MSPHRFIAFFLVVIAGLAVAGIIAVKHPLPGQPLFYRPTPNIAVIPAGEPYPAPGTIPPGQAAVSASVLGENKLAETFTPTIDQSVSSITLTAHSWYGDSESAKVLVTIRQFTNVDHLESGNFVGQTTIYPVVSSLFGDVSGSFTSPLFLHADQPYVIILSAMDSLHQADFAFTMDNDPDPSKVWYQNIPNAPEGVAQWVNNDSYLGGKHDLVYSFQ